jgi:hypothetical protein
VQCSELLILTVPPPPPTVAYRVPARVSANGRIEGDMEIVRTWRRTGWHVDRHRAKSWNDDLQLAQKPRSPGSRTDRDRSRVRARPGDGATRSGVSFAADVGASGL